MKKVVIITGIIFAACIVLAAVTRANAPTPEVAEQSSEGLTPRKNVQRLYFEPMEIRVPVTTFDFTDEPAMEIIVDPNAPLEVVE